MSSQVYCFQILFTTNITFECIQIFFLRELLQYATSKLLVYCTCIDKHHSRKLPFCEQLECGLLKVKKLLSLEWQMLHS